MPKCRNSVHLLVLLLIVAGCDNSQIPEKAGSPSPAAESPELSDGAAAECGLLKTEMIQLVVEMMKAQDPSIDPDKVSGQIQEAISELRKHYPEFLIVSAETEEKLKAGTPIPDSAKRIASAEKFFGEFQIQTSGLVQILLPQHKAGTLSPVRSELLAQLMTADMKKAEAALTN